MPALSSPRLTVGFLVLALVLWSGCSHPDPEAEKAKSAVASLDTDISALQAKAGALPRLEFSQEARRDLEVEAATLDFFSLLYSRLVPGQKGLDEETTRSFSRALSAVSTRSAPGVALDMNKGPEGLLDALQKMNPITGEDLQKLDSLADTYDSTLRLARESVRRVPPVPFNRTPATESFSQEYERKKSQYEGTAASLEEKNSSPFRLRVRRARDAHRVFEMVSGYLPKAGPIPPPPELEKEMARAFPSATDEAKNLADCWVTQDPECGQATLGSKRMAPLLKALAVEFQALLKETG